MTLYMTELGVGDWAGALAWYRDILGLPVLMVDEARRFALLGTGEGRLALKGGEVGGLAGRHRLTFLVDDLDDARRRLTESGVPPSEIIEDVAEGYRAFRVVGPEGIPIKVFAWSGQEPPRPRSDHAETSGRT